MKNFYIVIAFCGMLLGFPAIQSFADSESEKYFQKTWDRFSDICNEAVELAGQDDRNTRTALEVIAGRDSKYERMLKKAREVLAGSANTERFEDIDKLMRSNRELEHEAVELKRRRVSAPASSLNPLATTKKSIDKRLAAIPGEMDENREEIGNLKTSILNEFVENGINMTGEELDYFIISAEGEDLLRLMAMAENMKKIQKLMESEIMRDKNNLDVARMYTGMYLVSLEAWALAHDEVIKNMGQYRERLKDISRDASRNHDEAKKLLRRATDSERASMEANIAINRKAMDVAQMYDALLARRLKNLGDSKKFLGDRVAIARNTYNTMNTGRSLVSLVNAGSNDYNLLVNFEMPELKTIYDDAMLNAFMDISEKIRLER